MKRAEFIRSCDEISRNLLRSAEKTRRMIVALQTGQSISVALSEKNSHVPVQSLAAACDVLDFPIRLAEREHPKGKAVGH